MSEYMKDVHRKTFQKMTFEEELFGYRSALKVNLFFFVPILFAFTAYSVISAPLIATVVLSVILASDIVMLVLLLKPVSQPVELAVYRYVFPVQVLLLGLFFLYSIGVLGKVELSPWTFVFAFLALLVMRRKLGLIAVGVFAVCLALVTYRTGLMGEHAGLFVRLFSALGLFGLLHYSTEAAREAYGLKVAETQDALEKAAQEQRELSARLAAELERREQTERQLRQAHKMEAVGRLAAGVAHDLNNILSGIVSYPEELLLDLPEDSPLRGPIETIQESGTKAAAMVQDILTFSRRGVPVSEFLDLGQIVDDYLKSPEYAKMMSYHPGVRAETAIGRPLMNIKASPVHLLQVVMNVVTNAVESMPSDGNVKIGLHARHVDAADAAEQILSEGDYVVFSVSDSGVGIPEDDIEHLFEPFYTKKAMGRSGTGLGMSLVWAVVQDLEGHIEVKSVLNEGTTITIHFPATREEPSDCGETPYDIGGHNETVLVIDDLAVQRDIAVSFLKRLGYQTATASNGAEAVDYLKDHTVDLLVLDMIMAPGMDGLETYKQILEMHPGQKAIIASGFAESDRVKQVQQLGAGAYLQKPYRLRDFGTAVREALEEGERT